MKNETKESQNTARASVVINIHGGNNQILPNATEVVQNFYGAEFAHVRTQNKRKRRMRQCVLPVARCAFTTLMTGN